MKERCVCILFFSDGKKPRRYHVDLKNARRLVSWAKNKVKGFDHCNVYDSVSKKFVHQIK